ncbi:MAG: SpoIID/LytB domain-containing protein, partial [Planctomycetaceae bacterium]
MFLCSLLYAWNFDRDVNMKTRITAGLRRIVRRAKLVKRRGRIIAVFAMIGLAGVVAAVALPSCNDHDSIFHPKRDPIQVDPKGVPIIRVKLTPRPVGSSEISSNGGYVVLVDGKAISESASAMPNITFARSGGGWNIAGKQYAGQSLEIRSSGNSCIKFGANLYRGNFQLVPQGEQFSVVNHVDLESYVAGVLSKELLRQWQPATYHAFAVAARTFAKYQSITFGKTSFYDVTDDQGSQVYGGQTAETDKSWKAVNDTRGVMLAYTQNGQTGIFLTQYSSCCGGTVNGAYVLRDAPTIPPLMGGQPCEDCSASRLYRWAPVSVSKSDIFKAVSATYSGEAANLGGGVTDVRVALTTPYGRPVWLDVVGRSGKSVRLRADDLRLSLIRAKGSLSSGQVSSLYSMNCQIRSVGDNIEFYDGKGFGHGVGLC